MRSSIRSKQSKDKKLTTLTNTIIDERPMRTKDVIMQSEKTLQLTKSLLLRKGRYLKNELPPSDREDLKHTANSRNYLLSAKNSGNIFKEAL